MEAYIVDAVRTPRAKRKGKFSGTHPVDLLTCPLRAVVDRNGLAPESIEDVLIGCVTQTAEQSWCIARSAILASGWPISIPGTTINRLCGSGQQAINFAAQGIKAEHYNLVLAGGIEHMTRVPMFSDAGGEESPLLKHYHPDLVQQGLSAEIMADTFKLTREDLDRFALQSQQRAGLARSNNRFVKSIIPVHYRAEDGSPAFLDQDDNIRPDTTIEALSGLKLAFKENGKITAGNASAIVDGAASVLLASETALKTHGLTARARIVAMEQIGSDPLIMLTGPIEASRQVLKRASLKVQDIDLWEINEAFAPVPLATIKELGLDPSIVNVNGGGISLGHPLGATGAMLIGMALDELELRNKRYALVTMCIGLGMGIATIIENLSTK